LKRSARERNLNQSFRVLRDDEVARNFTGGKFCPDGLAQGGIGNFDGYSFGLELGLSVGTGF
jgi:hypothetical protein